MTKNIFEVEGIKFISNSDIEHYRIDTLLSKEPETIAWIQSFSNRVIPSLMLDQIWGFIHCMQQ